MRWLAIVALGLALPGCAFMLSGPAQTIEIETPRAEGARCTLIDSDDAARHLDSTPGQVTVPSGDGPFTISCGKAGFQTALASFDESLNPDVYWNLFNGIVPGLYIDSLSGAAQKYPEKIVVWLRPNRFASPTEEREWHNAKGNYEKRLKEKMK
ncbi:MAG: hypothetical protein QGH73_11415 [Rhodospirillales bacterium]|jgi:hypothetical protein|nr:hypothetical protein [Rhodospirillales bacterium]MDP6642518.1 hypothetical protein [Rhodospirillales bacterium]MDP6842277.1 hypothetical protein [Rhodospirillales bacterium]|tara:strand:- start:424 stop:885 length:462 start_codon:yes stop_codon:yes gene_type:complete